MRGSLLAVLFLTACGGKTESTPAADAAPSDSSASGADGAPADSSVADGADASSCFGADLSVPSVPFKLCMSASDCVAVTHQTDCCGNTLLVGVAKSQQDAFAACEKASRAAFPGCGCPAGPPQTEDGKTIDFGATPRVECRDFTSGGGICKTSAP